MDINRMFFDLSAAFVEFCGLCKVLTYYTCSKKMNKTVSWMKNLQCFKVTEVENCLNGLQF